MWIEFVKRIASFRMKQVLEELKITGFVYQSVSEFRNFRGETANILTRYIIDVLKKILFLCYNSWYSANNNFNTYFSGITSEGKSDIFSTIYNESKKLTI